MERRFDHDWSLAPGMRTDAIFYDLFRLSLATFFDLIERPEEAPGYNFASVEFKELSFRIDGVFQPVHDLAEHPIYLAEVQFQVKPDFYWRLFAEVFLFLWQEKPVSDWGVRAIFARRSLDPGLPSQFRALASEHLIVVYLDELAGAGSLSGRGTPGAGIIDLIVAPVSAAVQRGQNLVGRLQQERAAGRLSQEIMDLVEAVLVYKFPALTREELQAMFQVEDLKQTRVYQDALQEGKLEAVPVLRKLGPSPEQIAEELQLDLELVRKAVTPRRGRAIRRNGTRKPHENPA